MELKTLGYETKTHYVGEFVYAIRNDEMYFLVTLPAVTSVIDAEVITRTICDAEDIDYETWHSTHRPYDIQTARTRRVMEPDTFVVYRLDRIESGMITWTLEENLDPEVLETFRKHLPKSAFAEDTS